MKNSLSLEQGPLVPGITVIEASAGTGKTFQIAQLVVRLVAEAGLEMRSLLIVTFTRLATAELKDRIRTRLSAAAAALADGPADDEVLERFVERSRREGAVGLWLGRIREAQRSFDQASVSTIHGFCQRVLQQHAFESGADLHLELLQDTGQLVRELVDDWISREINVAAPARRGFLKADCRMSRTTLLAVAKVALDDPDRHLVPLGEARTLSQPWLDFVAWVRLEAEKRLHDRGQMVYHELLRRLAQTLRGSGGGALRDAVSARFSAALIDEFQDTDALQWEIFQRLFDGDEHHLYLIGDPKQSIYGFRGANLHVYEEATSGSKISVNRVALDTNFRSDDRLLRALEGLMGATRDPSLFGSDRVRFHPVKSHHKSDRLVLPAHFEAGWRDPRAAPIQLRNAGRIEKWAFNQLLPGQVAADVLDLLQTGHCLADEKRPLQPGDCAVLTRTGPLARSIRQALLDLGIPAVCPRSESVFSSPEAGHMERWLRAVARPGDRSAARAAAFAPLFGWTATGLRTLDEPVTDDNRAVHERWEAWLESLLEWHVAFAQKGLYQLFRQAMEEQNVATTLIGLPDGERRWTNLRHLAELLHEVSESQRLGLTGLVEWLQQERAASEQLDEDSPAEMRLERDDAAVQVMTLHKSKGLEFKVVFLPDLWSARWVKSDEKNHLVFSDPAQPTRRLLDVRRFGDGEDDSDRLGYVSRANMELYKESVRLLYVALTRACLRNVIYVGKVPRPQNSLGYESSPLGLLLHGDTTASCRFEKTPERIEHNLSVDAYNQDLADWADRLGHDGEPLMTVEAIPTGRMGSWADPEWQSPVQDLEVARFPADRRVDHIWGRVSYTSLVSSMRTKGIDSSTEAVESTTRLLEDAPLDTPEEVLEGRDYGANAGASCPAASDRTTRKGLAEALPDVGVANPVPLAEFPAGKDAGKYLHAIFEHLDFTRRGGDLAQVVGTLEPRFGFATEKARRALRMGVGPCLETPLGGWLEDLCLADIGCSDRLDELTFDLPIVGGDRHGAEDAARWQKPMSGRSLGSAFALGGPGDGIAERDRARLAERWLNHRFSGYLTGAMDLIFRDPRPGRGGRFYLADYKSNRLDLLQEKHHPVRHFCQAWMAHEMAHHHYTVQYHLYTLALHRYLRQRVRNYAYDTHFGGVLYLFVRGMVGADTPREGDLRHGVFQARPHLKVIEHLDGLLKGIER